MKMIVKDSMRHASLRYENNDSINEKKDNINEKKASILLWIPWYLDIS